MRKNLSLDKLERESQLIAALEAKQARIEKKIEAIQKRRQFLPHELPPAWDAVSCADSVKPVPEFIPAGFGVDLCPDTRQAIDHALVEDKFRQIHAAISEALLDVPEGVGLILLDSLQSKKRVLYVYYTFNPQLNEELKDLGARFNAKRKAWAFDLAGLDVDALSSVLQDFFSSVVNLTDGTVYRNLKDCPERLRLPFTGFQPMDYPVRVHADRLLALLSPDASEHCTIRFFEDNAWNALAPGYVFDTKMPFLLLQINSGKRSPDWMLYSVLAEMAEGTFSVKSRVGKRVFAQYAETCREHGLPVVSGARGPAYVPTPEEKSKLHGQFDRFRCFDQFRQKYPELGFFPLADDYIHFQFRDDPNDDHSYAAYVVHGDDGIGKAVAKYFGARGDEWPVVINRSLLSFDEDNKAHSQDEMCRLLCHEVAHCLHNEVFEDKKFESHGIHWYAAMQLLLLGFGPEIDPYDATVRKGYHVLVWDAFQSGLRNVIDVIRTPGPVSKEMLTAALWRFYEQVGAFVVEEERAAQQAIHDAEEESRRPYTHRYGDKWDEGVVQ